MNKIVQTKYFWKGSYQDVTNHVRKCSYCIQLEQQRKQEEAKVKSETQKSAEKVPNAADSNINVWKKVGLKLHFILINHYIT